MTDMVERLRNTFPYLDIHQEAAAEIERLRDLECAYDQFRSDCNKTIAELKAALADKDMMMAAANEAIENNLQHIDKLEAEIERLRGVITGQNVTFDALVKEMRGRND